MITTPVLEHVQANNYYQGPTGVAAGVATGFEAHCWCIYRGSTTPGAGVANGGLLSNGDGTDGWALSFSYDVATGLTTFTATFGDTGGPPVAITTGDLRGILGRFVLVSAFVADDDTVALAVNGDILVSGVLLGTYQPAAASTLDVGAVGFGLTPAIDMSFAGIAYDQNTIATTAAARRNAASRFMAVSQSRRMWRNLGWQVSALSPTDPVEYTNAWDSVSLQRSGPTTGTTLDRNLSPSTWLPRSGSESLARAGAGPVLNNLLNFDSNTSWAAAV